MDRGPASRRAGRKTGKPPLAGTKAKMVVDKYSKRPENKNPALAETILLTIGAQSVFLFRSVCCSMNDQASRPAARAARPAFRRRNNGDAAPTGSVARQSEPCAGALPARFAAAALLAAGLAVFGPAHAQSPAAGLQPNIDLNATLSAPGLGATQDMVPSSVRTVPLNIPLSTTSTDLFNEPPEPDGGWQALAHILQALTPSVNTELPLTPSQITDHINSMLNQGKAVEAMAVIQKRIAQEQARGGLGTDVQLMFLHARALAALDRHQEAIAVYRQMTEHYPELPEPWNNLAAEYLHQGKLEMARDALQMALTADPGYATANANLGQVQLMLAQQSFDRAARQGDAAAHARAQETQAVIQK